MARILWATFSATFLWGTGEVALAEKAESLNAREACRQTVAGHYLKVYDDLRQAQDYRQGLIEQLDQTRASLTKSQHQYRTLAAKARQDEFNTALASRRDDTLIKIQALERQQKNFERYQQTTEAEIELLTSQEKILKTAISKVFHFRKIPVSKSKGGYPFRIEYQKSCPKFRHLCPLSAEHGLALAQVKVDGDNPEACRRYIGISRAKRSDY